MSNFEFESEPVRVDRWPHFTVESRLGRPNTDQLVERRLIRRTGRPVEFIVAPLACDCQHIAIGVKTGDGEVVFQLTADELRGLVRELLVATAGQASDFDVDHLWEEIAEEVRRIVPEVFYGVRDFTPVGNRDAGIAPLPQADGDGHGGDGAYGKASTRVPDGFGGTTHQESRTTNFD